MVSEDRKKLALELIDKLDEKNQLFSQKSEEMQAMSVEILALTEDLEACLLKINSEV